MQTTAKKTTLLAIGDLIPLLRLEGLAICLSAIAVYAVLEQSWTLFAILFLAPDVAMIGYALGPRIGAIVYNAAHSYIGPLALGATGWLADWTLAIALAAIWIAHIGVDRAIGYGLKHRSGFKTTHLSAAVVQQ